MKMVVANEVKNIILVFFLINIDASLSASHQVESAEYTYDMCLHDITAVMGKAITKESTVRTITSLRTPTTTITEGRPSARYSVLVSYLQKSEQISMNYTRLHPRSTGDVLTGCLTDRHRNPGSSSRTGPSEFVLAVIQRVSGQS